MSLSPRTTTVLLLASILPLVDSSLVNVLLPSISSDLGVSESSVQLGVSGYMLAATAGIILSTTCLRRFGPRHVWSTSVIVFAIASTLVGLSVDLGMFVGARVLQGAACGFIMPAVQHLVAEIVGRDGMRNALATIGLPAVIAPAAGPLLGGILVDAVGWRTLFLVNVPVAVIALMMAPGALPTTTGRRTSLGFGQALPAVLGMVALLSVVSEVGSLSSGWIVLILGVAAVLVLVFCVADLRSSTPLLDVSLYRGTPFATVMALCLVVGAVFYGTLLSTSLHLQGELGQPAWVAGVFLGVQGLGAWAVRSLIKGPWKSSNAFVIIGLGLAVAATGTLVMQAVEVWGVVSAVVLALGAFIRGLGLGACTLVALSAAYEVVADDQTSAVGAHSRLMLQLGGALGTAAVGVWTGSTLSLGVAVALVCMAGSAGAGTLLLHQRRATA
ncbi:MFS transporter [Corynebacterium glyciniphilum]|uniref:MFS transporter n=1 Tax=Corynebacterium glyciniphilum TaxID=1404244 RepID=UPI003FCF3184